MVLHIKDAVQRTTCPSIRILIWSIRSLTWMTKLSKERRENHKDTKTRGEQLRVAGALQACGFPSLPADCGLRILFHAGDETSNQSGTLELWPIVSRLP